MKHQLTEEEQAKGNIYLERMMIGRRLNIIDRIRDSLQREEKEIYQRLAELDEMSKILRDAKQT